MRTYSARPPGSISPSMWGRRQRVVSPSRQYSHRPHPQLGSSSTRVPVDGWVTPAPVSATIPATSPPVMWGSGVGSPGMPSRVKMSRKLSAHAFTVTTISPGPATGRGHSRSSVSTSGPPCWWITIARIVFGNGSRPESGITVSPGLHSGSQHWRQALVPWGIIYSGCRSGHVSFDLLMEAEVREISAADLLRRILGQALSVRKAADLQGTDGPGPGADPARAVPRGQSAPADLVGHLGPRAPGQAPIDRRSVRGNERAPWGLHADRRPESRRSHRDRGDGAGRAGGNRRGPAGEGWSSDDVGTRRPVKTREKTDR